MSGEHIQPLHSIQVQISGAPGNLEPAHDMLLQQLRHHGGSPGAGDYASAWADGDWNNSVIIPLKRGAQPAAVEALRVLDPILPGGIMVTRDATVLGNLAPAQVRAVLDSAALAPWVNGPSSPFRVLIDRVVLNTMSRHACIRVAEPTGGQDLQCLIDVPAAVPLNAVKASLGSDGVEGAVMPVTAYHPRTAAYQHMVLLRATSDCQARFAALLRARQEIVISGNAYPVNPYTCGKTACLLLLRTTAKKFSLVPQQLARPQD